MSILNWHEVKDYYADLKTHYARMRREKLAEERAFLQHFEGIVDIPYEVQIHKSSTARNIVEGFRNQIRTNEPTVVFKQVGPSVVAAKEAILMQKWGYAMLRKERTLSVMDPTLQNGFDLLLRGAACKKITVDVDRMMEKPPKRGTRAYEEWEEEAIRTWAFISKAVDPLSVFMPPGQRKPYAFAIEKQSRYVQEVEDLYPMWKNPDKKGRPARVIEWIEYWSPEQLLVLADGVPVPELDKENPYGLTNYIFEWSGLGRTHEDNDPVHLAAGILTGILGEIEAEVRLKTAISVQTQMHVFPPILTVEDPKKVARQFGVGPGKVIKHPPGHPPVYMEYPPPNENMYRFLDTIQQNIARVFSSALAGGRDPGVNFGVLQAQMIGQALTTIAPVRATLDSIGAQTLNMMLAIAHKMDLHMAVEGGTEPVEPTMRVSGKDFKHQNFVVTFEAVDPAENDRALLVGQALRRAKDISRRTFWEKYAKHVVEDADEEEIRLLEEEIELMLVVSGAMGQAVLSEDVQEQFAEQAAEAGERVRGKLSQSQDNTPVSAAANARELEGISGTPGSQSVPRDVVEAGMANASSSQSGLPR